MTALQSNLKNFDLIIVCFFERKDLTIWNYFPEFCKFNRLLKKNFKELKKIIKNEKQSDQAYIYMEFLLKETVKIETNYLKRYERFLKKKHYSDILEYLKLEKENKPASYKVLYGNFFQCLQDVVQDYFLMKSRIYNEKEEN